jgi:hypothetical protein
LGRRTVTPFFFSSKTQAGCHPERSAPQARGAKDLLFEDQKQVLRACGAQDDKHAPSHEKG